MSTRDTTNESALLRGLLLEVLDEQLREPLRGVVRRLIDAGETSALDHPQEELEAELRTLSAEGAVTVIRALTILFDLENIAEDRQRIRTLRRREEAAYPAPRSESVAEAVQELADAGLMPEHLAQLFGGLLIKPVLTAHPTEAKRYEIIRTLRSIKSELAKLERTPHASPGHTRTRARIKAHLTTLWQTERIRPSRPTVLDEAEHALSFLRPLWNVVPALYQDLRTAVLNRYPGSPFQPPAFFRFGSWIGGDRDGNPNVTADVTRRVVLRQRQRVLELHLAQCERVTELLTASDRRAGVSQALRERLSELEEQHPEVRAAARPYSVHEPYRRFFAAVGWRLRRTRASVFREDGLRFLPGAYTHSDELIADVDLAMNSLRAHRGQRLVDGLLGDWYWQARVFRFHGYRLDIRQNSRWNGDVLDEVLVRLGVCDDYGGCREVRRRELLEAVISGERTLEPVPDDVSDQTKETAALFRLIDTIAHALEIHTLGGYIISMTHDVSDVLAVFALYRVFTGKDPASFPLPVVPLLETIDDLRDGGETLEGILSHPLYRRQLEAQGNSQIVMIGYSDSTKDGGYLAANWALYQGQIRLAETARTHGVRLVFFHGRGGSLGRGGGPAAEGILALPPDTLRFGLRVTEQGEVLAERYGDPDIAYRHLEQLLWATVTAAGTGRAGSEDRWHATMQELAEDALSEYRGLIGTEGFVRYFERATPLEEIEVLPIASRPARRAGERSLDNLRAIPWVFSWSESRVLLPAWFGLGAAVERYADKHGWDTLREMYDEWRFFRTVIDNAALALAKTDMPIAERYAGLVEDRELGERLFRWISEEHRRTATAIVRVTGSDALLDTTPWLRDAVRKRNPFTLPLNLLQVIWLERARAGEPEAQAEAHEVVRLTIQGVASALRNTG